MATKVITVEEQKRQSLHDEALLLLTRLSSDLVAARKVIDEMRQRTLNRELMAQDPHHVSDNLGGVLSPLMHFDISRLRAIVRSLA